MQKQWRQKHKHHCLESICPSHNIRSLSNNGCTVCHINWAWTVAASSQEKSAGVLHGKRLVQIPTDTTFKQTLEKYPHSAKVNANKQVTPYSSVTTRDLCAYMNPYSFIKDAKQNRGLTRMALGEFKVTWGFGSAVPAPWCFLMKPIWLIVVCSDRAPEVTIADVKRTWLDRAGRDRDTLYWLAQRKVTLITSGDSGILYMNAQENRSYLSLKCSFIWWETGASLLCSTGNGEVLAVMSKRMKNAKAMENFIVMNRES